jgi:hypothetical protein
MSRLAGAEPLTPPLLRHHFLFAAVAAGRFVGTKGIRFRFSRIRKWRASMREIQNASLAFPAKGSSFALADSHLS